MSNSPTNDPTILYADFISICDVRTPADFHGFRVETNGLFTIVPGNDVMLMPMERVALSWHPTGHYDQPALPFPCTLVQLRKFVADAGLSGCLDEEAITYLVKMPDTQQELAPDAVVDDVRAAVQVAPTIDYKLLATPDQLIGAFGSFTGMDAAWFKNLTDSPALLDARKVVGKSGRHFEPPLFCPYMVMSWLVDPKRKKGRRFSDNTAWRLLQAHFPNVYAQYLDRDARTD